MSATARVTVPPRRTSPFARDEPRLPHLRAVARESPPLFGPHVRAEFPPTGQVLLAVPGHGFDWAANCLYDTPRRPSTQVPACSFTSSRPPARPA